MWLSSLKFVTFVHRAAFFRGRISVKCAAFWMICASLLIASGGACGGTVTYVGAEGGDWDTPSNWDPTKVPTSTDDVVINGKWVKSAGSIIAKSILVKGAAGALTVAGTAKDVTAQTKVAGNTTPVTLMVMGDLVVDGGKLSLGAVGASYNVSAGIGGDLVVTNGAVAAFHAGETDGVDAIDPTGTAAKLFANANVISVAGTFRVGKGSTVYHESNRLSGTPVLFKVKDFVQEAGAVNTAEGRGWGKITYSSNPPVRTIKENSLYTYALGAGDSYGYGAGHGAKSGSIQTKNLSYINADGTTTTKSYNVGGTYGYAFAPFLPGSPNGAYNGVAGNTARGGGAVCIWASGTATVAGTLNAKGVSMYYGAPSAGSVWLAAKRLDVRRSASLVAEGGTCTGNYSSSGGAGRVALAVGLTEAELGQLAANAQPADLSLRSADATGVNINVLGGQKHNGAGGRSASGTAKLVWAANVTPYEVTATPEEYSSATPGYGFHAVPTAELPSSFTTAESATYPAFYRNLRRFAHNGIVVTTGAVEIAFADIATATEPVKVTHQWTKVEDLVRVRVVGGGSVSVGGTAYTADTDLWRTAGTDVSATAAAGSGTFVRWIGDFAGGAATGGTLEKTVNPGMTLWAVFSDATGVAKSYVGASGGFWDVGSNWSPAGVPTPADDVTVGSGKFVKSYGMTAAKSLTLNGGKLAVGGMNSPNVTVISRGYAYASLNNQVKPSDYAMTGSGLFVAGSIALSGAAEVTLGAYRQATPFWCLAAEGDITLANTAKLTAYAKTYDGPVNASGKIELTSHYSSATVVRIGGDLSLADTSAVIVESEAVTGAPVKWQVAGDVTIGASACFDAMGRGYQWISFVTEGSTDPRYLATETTLFTLSPGYGYSYTFGGRHGGSYDDSYGKAYGFDVAPYTAGGPSGGNSAYFIARGGGAVWIVCEGEFTLNGSVQAKGAETSSTGSGAAGGGIWIATAKFRPGVAAKLDAGGAKAVTAADSSGGCGGRICVAEGVTAEQLDVLATGERPSALSYGDTIAGTTVSVAGGFCKKDNTSGVSYYGVAGTIVHITGAVSEYPIEIHSTPVKCQAENLDYAAKTVEKGKLWSMTIGSYGYDPANPANVRYACAGWVISNTTEQVASGSGSTASFTPDVGPFTLTWIWNDRHVRHQVNVPAHATLTVNGTTYAEPTSLWIAEATPVTLTVAPEAGYELLCWEGPIAFGKAQSATQNLPAGKPSDVTPVVRAQASPVTRTWRGGTASWATAAKWDPEGVPGAADSLVVGSGICVVSNFLECGALKLSGAAALKVAEAASSGLEEAALVVHGDLVMTNTASLLVSSRTNYRHGRLVVEGDLKLVGTNTFTVSAGPTNLAEFAHSNGAGWVTVGGDFIVAGGSTVVPNSSPWTGGSVVFRVGHDFTLGPKASFKAHDNGYQRVSGRSPVTLGPGAGYDYFIGAGYGGYGMASGEGAKYDPTTGQSYHPTLGHPYGFAYAPVEPGSPAGHYGDHPGGGLVRIHAGHDVTLAGTLNASARAGDTDISSASGGGIWVTAGRKLVVEDGAVLKARGGYRCVYTGLPGGGGRIGLGEKMRPADVEALARTGTVGAWRKFAKHEKTEEFRTAHPNVTVDVRGGEDATGIYEGTFRVLDGSYSGLMLLVR